MLTLVNGDARCTVHPTLGGSLGSWRIGAQDMLRAATDEAIEQGDLLGMASFPLVPYSNRIGGAKFEWHGQPVQLQPNFPPEPHAIHGVGWKRRWDVREHADSSVVLSLLHEGDADWPWPFSAEQRIVLGEASLHLTLSATNLADMVVPLGFGHHPYFDAAGASLCFESSVCWEVGDDRLPTNSVLPTGARDFAKRASISGRAFDNCFTRPARPTTIDWDGRDLALAIDQCVSLAATVVYIPPDGGFFCVEPVPHVNNALNMPGTAAPMPLVAPGDSFTGTITLTATSNQRGGASESR